ncbi:hypothetical protein [Streptomyces orinoci]|uniref:Uncharacterized protein n=1 Tax=Streptomyces orinoci TaxID=67339 RepID=A0ABV3JZ84_STRON|nr:hypothetical protein [Streptomyces orinoci]
MSAADDLRVAFHDYRRPVATAGVYTIRTEQHLTHNGSRLDADSPIAPAEQRFEIRAVRFVLDPSSVHATYPPPGGSGDYSRVLPHITLNRSILPWERELRARRAPDRAPWLAVLVVRAGELPDDPEGLGATATRTVAELRRPGPGILGPLLSDDGITPEIEATRCQTLDVPAGLFTAVVPREEELNYLAHVRDVTTAPQQRDNGEVVAEGQYAVVAANRLPREPGSWSAHLVSLEGFEGRLAPGSLPAGTQAVRLCVLHSWSFTSDPDGRVNASALLGNLVAPAHEDPENLVLRLTSPAVSDSTDEAASYARRRLELGYVPVPYRLLSGETTYGWYRGPFTPVTAAPTRDFIRDEPRTTADHALIYDPEHGLFDVSYAAAWTLGRTLALSDPDYAEEITRARRELANTATRTMATAADPRLASADDPADPRGTALRELADPGFARELLDALAQPRGRSRESDPPPPEPRTRMARTEARALLASTPRQAALRAAAARQVRTLPDWLDGLRLLRRVPFAYLVPDARMLPPESLRLFRVDAAWLGALEAGARDVGVHTSLDAAVDFALTAAVDGARTGAVRPAAGLLMRSEFAHAYPVFDLWASAGGSPVAELRRDHMAPDTVLVLLDAVPDEVVIREPGQGLHFGIDTDRHGNGVVNLRDINPGDPLGFPLGRTYPADGGSLFDHHLRPRPDGTPDVLALRGEGGLVPALARALDPDLTDLTPGGFALQLVNAPVEQRLTVRAAADHQENTR